MKKNKFAIILLLTNLFIAFVGFGLVTPVMPSFMNEMNLSGSIMGYLMAAFAFSEFIFSIFAVKWLDRFGRKSMIVLGLFIFSLSEFIFGIGQTVEVLFLSRILGGLAAGLIMPAVMAFIGDITTHDERAKAMGFVSAAISLGFIIGPGIGGFLAGYGIRVPFYFAAAIACVVAFISLFSLKEPLTQEELWKRRQTSKQTSFFKDIRKSFKPMYFTAFFIIFILSFGLAAYETVFSLFTDHKFGFTPSDIALIITVSSLIAVVVQLLFFDKLVNLLGEKKLIQICLVIAAVFAFLSTVVGTFAIILGVSCIIFLCFDLLRPALTTYLSRAAESEQAYVAGMNSAYTSLGNIAGPALAGILFDWNINFPYLFSGLTLLFGFGVTWLWKAKQFGHASKANHLYHTDG